MKPSNGAHYTPQELRSHRGLPGPPAQPEVSWVEEHLLVIAGGSRHNQAEPDGTASLVNQAIKDQARQISARRAGEAPNRRPGARAQNRRYRDCGRHENPAGKRA